MPIHKPAHVHVHVPVYMPVHVPVHVSIHAHIPMSMHRHVYAKHVMLGYSHKYIGHNYICHNYVGQIPDAGIRRVGVKVTPAMAGLEEACPAQPQVATTDMLQFTVFFSVSRHTAASI